MDEGAVVSPRCQGELTNSGSPEGKLLVQVKHFLGIHDISLYPILHAPCGGDTEAVSHLHTLLVYATN